MKALFCILFACCTTAVQAQELYVFTEPASNMPAHTLSPRLSGYGGRTAGRWNQRLQPELMFGFSKKLMVHTGTSFSNYYAPQLRWEGAWLYAKYRFFSVDEVHRHFRMAAFTDWSYSRNGYHFQELSLRGDRSGGELGLIATQLVNRFAASASISHAQAFDAARKQGYRIYSNRSYQSLNYSLSGGVLLLPRHYSSYEQLNLNAYAELLGQRSLDQRLYYIDLAPAVQFIFHSNSKLNLGYRFQLSGNQTRSMRSGFLVSFEHTFFNAL